MPREVDQLIRLVKSKFGEYRESGEDVRVCCPFCPTRGRSEDTDFKLYINPVRDVVHCFRCEYSGRAKNLFPQLVTFGGTSIPRKSESVDLEPLPVCCELYELPPDHLAVEYITQIRGFTLAELQDRAFFCKDYCKGDFSFGPRIIFPFYQSDLYRGFQARTIWMNTEPKYISATGMKKKSILYNFDNAFSQNEELIITEGPLDVIRVGTCAVALLGKAISDEQLRLIQLGDFKRIIVFLDPDAEKEVEKTTKKLARYFNTFTGPDVCKDPGEMGVSEIREYLENVKRVY